MGFGGVFILLTKLLSLLSLIAGSYIWRCSSFITLRSWTHETQHIPSSSGKLTFSVVLAISPLELVGPHSHPHMLSDISSLSHTLTQHNPHRLLPVFVLCTSPPHTRCPHDDGSFPSQPLCDRPPFVIIVSYSRLTSSTT